MENSGLLGTKRNPVRVSRRNAPLSIQQGALPPCALFLLVLLLCWGKTVVLAVAQGRVAQPSVNLHGVSFLTKEEGWAVGQLGKIFHTVDGGKSWDEQSSGTNLLLTAVDFVDRTHGWAVGERGVILHTTNGGATWREQQSGTPYPLFDVKFLDQKNGWAVGHWGTILTTRDGGKQWLERSLTLPLKEQGLIEPAAFHDVIDPETGEVIARARQLLTKSVIGEIFRRGIDTVQIREDLILYSVFFLDGKQGWIAGERGLVLRTENGGESWEKFRLPRPPVQEAEGKEEVRAEELLVLGDEMSEEELAAFGIVAPPPSLYGIFFVSPFQGWVVGQEGVIARTSDGGRQWEFQSSGTREALYDVGAVGNEGWIVGDKGVVLVSQNGGMEWKRMDLESAYSFSWLGRLAVVSGDHAFLVGADGHVLVSGKSPDGIRVHSTQE